MGQESRSSAGLPVEDAAGAGGWSDRELAELHAAALGVGARAGRLAAAWGSPPMARLRAGATSFEWRKLIARAATDVPAHLGEALALLWPVLALVALAALRLGPADPIPPELRRGVLLLVLALAVPIVLHLWIRQRGGKAQPAVLGTLMRVGPRELTAVLIFVPLIAGAGLVGAFLAAVLRAFGAAPVWQAGGWLLAGALFVQWSTLSAAFAREDDRSPLAVQRAAMRALPALLAVALPLGGLALLAVSGAAGRITEDISELTVDLVLLGWTGLLLVLTLGYGSALAYALEATAEPAA